MAYPIQTKEQLNLKHLSEKEFSLTELGVPEINIQDKETKPNLTWSECEKDIRNIILKAAGQVGTIIEDPILLHWMTVDITRYIHSRFGLDPDLPEYKK